MTLHTFTGLRWPAVCACGCGSIIPAGPTVPIVVQLGTKPRMVWIPEHSPGARAPRAAEGTAHRIAAHTGAA